MRSRDAETPVSRLLLLLLVGLGVALMHTMGHPAHEMRSMPTMPGVASAVGGHVGGHDDGPGRDSGGDDAGRAPFMSRSGSASHQVATGLVRPGDGPGQVYGDAHRDRGGLDPLTICLAVLIAVLVFTALPFLARRPAASAGVRAAFGRAQLYDVRGPPRVGLSMTRMAVLRT